MARPLRIEHEGALYHVTSRGNERKAIFKDNQDRELFLNILNKVNDRYHCLCYTYCLMNNHYHLIVETSDGNLAQGMRQLNGVYTQASNRKHGRMGHLFQGRYKAILVQKESYLLEDFRYVVLNPVRAKAVDRPEEWKWSSYRAMGGLERPHPCLTTDWVLGQWGERRGQAGKKYREFVKAGIGGQSIWEKVKGQSLLGEDDFVKRIQRYLKGREEIKEVPKSQRYMGRPSLERLFEGRIVREKRWRDRSTVEAVEEWGYSQKEVADYLGLHYSTISRAIKQNQEMSRIKT